MSSTATMESNLPDYIELIDSTPHSQRTISEIHMIIKSWFEDPDENQEVCDSVFEVYCDLCSLELQPASLEKWINIYEDFKILRAAIKNRFLERRLTHRERTSNLHLIDGILFYIKLTILRLRSTAEEEGVLESESENDISLE